MSPTRRELLQAAVGAGLGVSGVTVDLAEAREDLQRRRLIPFTRRMHKGYRAAQHHQIIASALEDVAWGRIRYLILTLPPRHGKSLLASVHFPGWYLGNNPDKWVMATSYSANLSYRFSRQSRRMLHDARWPFPWVRPAKGANQAQMWELGGHAGGYIAAGVGGSITGMGANVLIVDDPVKNQADAESEVMRENTWDWFTSTAMTRLENDGAVVLIGTRWNEDDLIGRALNPEYMPGIDWTHINFPAQAETDDDALGRAKGEYLWPEKYSAREYDQIKARVGPRVWAALYQQRPSPEEGAMFPRNAWNFVNPAHYPAFANAILTVDSAFKEGAGSDFSALAAWATDGKGRYFCLDVVRGRWEFPALIDNIHRFHSKWRHLRRIVPVHIEDRASGQSAIQVLRRPYVNPDAKDARTLPALPVVPFPAPASEGKIARADGITYLVTGGNVYLPEGAGWTRDFIEEHAAFPNGAHDDTVDTTSMGLIILSRPRPNTIRSY